MIDPNEQNYDDALITRHENTINECLADGMTEDEAQAEADREIEEYVNEQREMGRCCPNGCRGFC